MVEVEAVSDLLLFSPVMPSKTTPTKSDNNFDIQPKLQELEEERATAVFADLETTTTVSPHQIKKRNLPAEVQENECEQMNRSLDENLHQSHSKSKMASVRV